ncbi:hypothetical protein N781_16525 [Pontibacillus halophilus JSM 076056 = DSM 19796]|uniref:Uncharacterized protein n=1 Tax=Pontibacillus halophilus JSM 076056 = DSM 19796 TaxID=1385510 RepID=A0A0A5GMA3_9BACI|nr:hypothetical protein [Pontibacillus halophilus]KGX92358.1 hypothetical protein N781_16525 [Pontibacillus halophilus JSM 076056 = DSM 19796]
MLWVLTQNEKSLMNVKQVVVKGKDIEGVMGRSFFTDWSGVLGKYESNARAKEILKEMVRKIEEGSSLTYSMPKE